MPARRTAQLILALAFVLGQWFAVVHATQHELSAADRLVACEVCAVGHAAAPPPAAAAPLLRIVVAIESPVRAPVDTPRVHSLLRPPTRGPPSPLV